jgi:NAD(P)-dependent dehydrogenase (short-subunit alcohol dehydrogenase family)
MNKDATAMEKNLEGMVALVTGASRGIGRAIALGLAHQGATLALSGRDSTELEQLKQHIAAQGGKAAWFAADIADEAQAVKLVRDTVTTFGRLDILINNAGIGTFGPLEQTTTAQWDAIMAINARAPFILCREALGHLRRQPLSFIINIGSVVSTKGYAEQAAYSASKHALMGMSKALAKEVGGENVRVHMVCPGGVDTELVSRARPDLDRSVLMQPQEVADAVLYLLSMRGAAIIDEIHLRRAASTPFA